MYMGVGVRARRGGRFVCIAWWAWSGKAGGLRMGIQAMQHSESKEVLQLFFDSSYSLDSTLSIFM